MLSARTFDEVNNMNQTYRAIDFETYFGEMELSEEEKNKRISLAERLEENFVFVLAFLFYMQQYGNINWENIRVRFQNAYTEALNGVIVNDITIQNYIEQFSYNVTDSSQKHVNDVYYYSTDRAKWMSENESNTIWNYSNYRDAINSGKTMKRWVDIRDRRERESHRKVGGTSKPIEEPFMVGDSFMMYPKDDSLGASDDQIVNCRCSILYY